jgi:hypothetical protein
MSIDLGFFGVSVRSERAGGAVPQTPIPSLDPKINVSWFRVQNHSRLTPEHFSTQGSDYFSGRAAQEGKECTK